MPGAHGHPPVVPVVAWLLCVGAALWAGPSPAEGPFDGLTVPRPGSGEVPSPVEGLRPAGGEVQLSVRPADVVKEAFLLERTSQAKYAFVRGTGGHPAEEAGSAPAAPGAPPWTGAATGLPPGSYDVVLITSRGRVDGVGLKPPLAAQAPETLGEKEENPSLPEVPSAVRPALSAKDVESIRKLVLGMTSFADRRRILFLEGSGTEARALVEELTTRKTSLPSPVPFVVWRVEVWSYRKEFGAWDRSNSQVIARERLPVTEFEQTTWVFEPALGGLQVTEATPVVQVAYEVPQEFDPTHGLVAGKQKLPGNQESR